MFPKLKSIFIVFALAIAVTNLASSPDAPAPAREKQKMYKALQAYIHHLLPTFEGIETERKAELKALAATVQTVQDAPHDLLLQEDRPPRKSQPSVYRRDELLRSGSCLSNCGRSGVQDGPLLQ
jgi:hypothetical protein